jgi:hypothetical protein
VPRVLRLVVGRQDGVVDLRNRVGYRFTHAVLKSLQPIRLGAVHRATNSVRRGSQAAIEDGCAFRPLEIQVALEHLQCGSFGGRIGSRGPTAQRNAANRKRHDAGAGDVVK